MGSSKDDLESKLCLVASSTHFTRAYVITKPTSLCFKEVFDSSVLGIFQSTIGSFKSPKIKDQPPGDQEMKSPNKTSFT